MNLETDIKVWITLNKDELKQLIKPIEFDIHLFPPSFQDVIINNYKQQALSTIKNHINEIFHLNPEELYGIITEKLINELLGNTFLHP
jgi:hypothetical protein